MEANLILAERTIENPRLANRTARHDFSTVIYSAVRWAALVHSNDAQDGI